jgi:vitamin K-dependent gamma-carboxylase
MFPWIMSACALIFFPPEAAQRSWAWLERRFSSGAGRAKTPEHAAVSPSAVSPRTVSPRTVSPLVRVGLLLGCLYVAFQVVMPFRYLAYGGNVLWHEQGMRFSWRVMLRAKGGTVSFLVKVPQQERKVLVDPKAYLTSFQENEMVGQPDLILQMAHHIGQEYEARGKRPVEVYATADISLNGRRAAPLLDPSVNLMKVRDGLAPASWILPAPTQAPPQIVPVL